MKLRRGPTFGPIPTLPLKNTTWKRVSKKAWWMEAEKEMKNLKSRQLGQGMGWGLGVDDVFFLIHGSKGHLAEYM